MIIVYCSKPQRTDAVTPTPLAHRSHTCMRALALGHDNILLILTPANANCRPKPTLLLALRHTNQTQHWPKPGSWTLVYTHRSSNDHRSHVITQSPPGPKGPLAPYVHTQETVDHALLRVAVCNTTVLTRLSVACETISTKERVVTNRVAYSLHAGLMPQRHAITMIIIYCSKPQQTDAVTPTPLAHRSHTCMRALALGHDTDGSDRWPSKAPVAALPRPRPCATCFFT